MAVGATETALVRQRRWTSSPLPSIKRVWEVVQRLLGSLTGLESSQPDGSDDVDGLVWKRDDGSFTGWARDAAHPEETRRVEIHIDGRHVASVVAENAVFFQSLPPESFFAGFDYLLPNGYRSGKLTLVSFRHPSGRELRGSPFVVQPSAAPAKLHEWCFDGPAIPLVTEMDGALRVRIDDGAQTAEIVCDTTGTSVIGPSLDAVTVYPEADAERTHPSYRPWLAYAARLERVVVDFDHGTIFHPDGRIWRSTTYLRDVASIEATQTRIRAGTLDGTVAEPFAILTADMASNYFHWHLDCLGGWYQASRRFGHEMPTLAPKLSGIQSRSFELLTGVTPQVQTGLRLCSEVLVGSAFDGRGIFPDPTLAGMFDQIRESAQATATRSPTGDPRGTLLFISRKDAPSRALANEDELFARLAPYGFVKLELSEMSYDQQVLQFADATCIVATHGAGLTNLGFCREGTRIFEIIPTNYVNCCFRFLSSLRNLRHFMFLVDAGDPLIVPVQPFLTFFRSNAGDLDASWTASATMVSEQTMPIAGGDRLSIVFHGAEDAHQLSASVATAFKTTLALGTTLPDGIFAMDGASGAHYRAFIHTLVGLRPAARYLEVGSWPGSTACAAMHGNHVKVTCIDDWSEPEASPQALLAAVDRFRTGDVDVSVLDANIRDVNYAAIGRFNIYLHQGPHADLDPFDAIGMALKALDDTFVMIVGDWNASRVRAAVARVTGAFGLRTLYSIEIRTIQDHTHSAPEHANTDWRAGYMIGVFSKPPGPLA